MAKIENTRFETLRFSPLTKIHIAIADSSVLPLLFLLLTYIVATKIGNYPELDRWNIIHILGFITPKFLPICLMIMSVLSIFQAWIWMGVGKGKFVNDLGVGNISDTKITWSVSMLGFGWLSVLLHYL